MERNRLSEKDIREFVRNLPRPSYEEVTKRINGLGSLIDEVRNEIETTRRQATIKIRQLLGLIFNNEDYEGTDRLNRNLYHQLGLTYLERFRDGDDLRKARLAFNRALKMPTTKRDKILGDTDEEIYEDLKGLQSYEQIVKRK